MAWDSKSGILNTRTLSDDEYWSLFNYVFVGGAKKTSTYKLAQSGNKYATLYFENIERITDFTPLEQLFLKAIKLEKSYMKGQIVNLI